MALHQLVPGFSLLPLEEGLVGEGDRRAGDDEHAHLEPAAAAQARAPRGEPLVRAFSSVAESRRA